MAENSRTFEARVRLAAKHVGWRVGKSRARIMHANDAGLFQLINECNIIVGGDRYDATLDDRACWIEKERQRQAA